MRVGRHCQDRVTRHVGPSEGIADGKEGIQGVGIGDRNAVGWRGRGDIFPRSREDEAGH